MTIDSSLFKKKHFWYLQKKKKKKKKISYLKGQLLSIYQSNGINLNRGCLLNKKSKEKKKRKKKLMEGQIQTHLGVSSVIVYIINQIQLNFGVRTFEQYIMSFAYLSRYTLLSPRSLRSFVPVAGACAFNRWLIRLRAPSSPTIRPRSSSGKFSTFLFLSTALRDVFMLVYNPNAGVWLLKKWLEMESKTAGQKM